MATIQELKQRIDLHDVADRLGLERPQRNGNYKSPHHKDKNPSLSIFEKDGRIGWKDFSSGHGGDHVDLVCYVQGCEAGEAVKWLHEEFGIPFDKPQRSNEPVEKSRAEWIADQCREHRDRALEYLVGERKITEAVAKLVVEKGAVGFNVWTNPKLQAGEFGYGGPAVAFIVRAFGTGRVVAVDMRYLDAELNGGVKTQTHGEKYGVPWFSDAQRLRQAHTVYLVESSINALSIDCCHMKGVAAVAIRGTGNAGNLDLSWAQGKRVILCMDDDQPDEKGHCPGAEAAWILYERLTAMNVAAHMVDWTRWRELKDPEVNDVNDILKSRGADDLRHLIKDSIAPWVIAGMPGDDTRRGNPRVFLPHHDFQKYWMFRAKEDFTTYVAKREKVEHEDGTETNRDEFADLCGFRVASVSRVTIASAVSTMTGEDDAQPRVLFAVTVQTPRHGPKLQRRVMDDDQLHNIDQWKKFGPVFSPSQFSRMLSILERGAHLGARDATNFVGLCWRGGKLMVNEGPDTYFQDPAQQCAYHALSFPSGTPAAARKVISAYQATFTGNPALLLLAWALGAHMKVLLGFWPHAELQAEKGSGKSTLVKRVERSIAMTMFSGQSSETAFRLLTSISCTSHPVGWEELSARRQDVIDKAVAMLQESYQYTVTRRGSEMKEFVLAAPVLLAGEDVPVKSLIGKLVRFTVEAKQQGPLIPEDLPRFPVRQWLEFLAGHTRHQVQALYTDSLTFCRKNCRAALEDGGAKRMTENYAALYTAWRLLSQFADVPDNQGNVAHDVIREMNNHISQTSGDRQPWVWLMELLLSEISAGKYRHPYTVNHDEENTLYLAFMPRDVMHHIRTSPGLAQAWDASPVKSHTVFKKQLKAAGVVLKDDVSFTRNGARTTHAVALSAEKLAEFGLHVQEPDVQAG